MFALLDAMLLWLDQSLFRYWALAGLAGSLTVASALSALFAPQWLARWNRPAVFGLLIGCTVFACRWPVLFNNTQDSNPDESQMIAGAIVLKSGAQFWQSVDGTTHGPLVQWPLAWLGAAGIRLDFTNARIFSAVLAWVLLIWTWMTLRVLFGDGRARLLVLPAVCLLSTPLFFDFVQYSSEQVPLAMLAFATWLLVRETLGGNPPRGWALALAGLVLGALPFAKLQTVPLGLWAGAGGLVGLWMAPNTSTKTRWRGTAWLIGGASVLPVLMFAWVVAHGIWDDLLSSYIIGNLMYAEMYPQDWIKAPQALADFAAKGDNFGRYFYGMLWLLLAGLLLRGNRWRGVEARFVVFSVGALLVAIYTVLAPNRSYTHYLQILIAPAALAAGAAFGGALRRSEEPVYAWERAPWSPGRYVLVLGFLVGGLYFQGRSWFDHGVRQLGRYTATHGKLSRPADAQTLIHLTTGEDSFALWGWEPRLYVETNRRHATREAHSALQIYDTPMREFYRTRYLADLKRTRPSFFVDAVGPGHFAFTDRAQFGYETFPVLAVYVGAEYQLVADVEGTRIFARKDRAAAAQQKLRSL